MPPACALEIEEIREGIGGGKKNLQHNADGSSAASKKKPREGESDVRIGMKEIFFSFLFFTENRRYFWIEFFFIRNTIYLICGQNT